MGKVKHNIPMCVALILLVLVLVTTYMTGGLFARYTANQSGGDSARVAKFQVLADSEIDVIDVNCATDQNGVYSFTVTNHSEVTVGYSVTVQFKNNMPQNLLQVALDSGAYGDLDANKAISFPVNENLDPLGDSATHEIRFQVIPEEFFGSAQGEESVELALDFTVTVHVQQID